MAASIWLIADSARSIDRSSRASLLPSARDMCSCIAAESSVRAFARARASAESTSYASARRRCTPARSDSSAVRRGATSSICAEFASIVAEASTIRSASSKLLSAVTVASLAASDAISGAACSTEESMRRMESSSDSRASAVEDRSACSASARARGATGTSAKRESMASTLLKRCCLDSVRFDSAASSSSAASAAASEAVAPSMKSWLSLAKARARASDTSRSACAASRRVSSSRSRANIDSMRSDSSDTSSMMDAPCSSCRSIASTLSASFEDPSMRLARATSSEAALSFDRSASASKFSDVCCIACSCKTASSSRSRLYPSTRVATSRSRVSSSRKVSVVPPFPPPRPRSLPDRRSASSSPSRSDLCSRKPSSSAIAAVAASVRIWTERSLRSRRAAACIESSATGTCILAMSSSRASTPASRAAAASFRLASC